MTLLLMAGFVAAKADDLSDILTCVEANNTEIKAGLAAFVADSAALAAVNNLEDPQVDFEYNFGGSTGDKWGIGVSQSFDWPGLYSARGKAAGARQEALYYTHLARRAEVLLQARLLCIGIVALNRLITASQAVYDNVDELYVHYSKAFEYGEVTVIDLNKIKIERVNARQRLEELKTQREETKNELRGLNGNRDFGSIDLDTLKDYPREQLATIDQYKRAFETYDPQNASYASLADALQSEISVARMGWLPRFDIGYQYTYELGDNFNGVTAGVSIPIFSNRKKVAQARAQAVASELSRIDYQAAREARICELFKRVVALRTQLQAYDEVTGDDSCFTLLRRALEGGQISLLEYLLETQYFLEARSNYLSLESQYHTALAELNRYPLQ